MDRKQGQSWGSAGTTRDDASSLGAHNRAGAFFSGQDVFLSEKTWRVIDGGWRVTDGGWRVTDGDRTHQFFFFSQKMS